MLSFSKQDYGQVRVLTKHSSRADGTIAVHFGSKADMMSLNCDVRFTPKADIYRVTPNVRFVPIADIVPATRSKQCVGNAGAQCTRCDIAFAETTGRCAASAMAMPRPLAMQA